MVWSCVIIALAKLKRQPPYVAALTFML